MENSRNDYEAMDKLMARAKVIMRVANEDHNYCLHIKRPEDGIDICDINGKKCSLEDNMKCDEWEDIKYERGLDE